VDRQKCRDNYTYRAGYSRLHGGRILVGYPVQRGWDLTHFPQIKVFTIIAVLVGFYFFASPYQTCLRDNAENDNKEWVHENCKLV